MFVDNFDLVQTAVVKRRSYTPDMMGGVTASSATIATIACAIWVNSGNEQKVSDRNTYVSSNLLACHPSTKYLVSDFVVHKGSSYRITNIDDVTYAGEIMIVSIDKVDHGVGQ